MKKALILLFSIAIISCKAQTIKPLYLSGSFNSGNYYKDIDNDLDKFVGTWLYTNDIMTFKIILKKRTNIFDTYSNCYVDIIVGEYQYIENGIEQTNTLSSIDINPESYEGNQIRGNLFSRCDGCLPGQRKVLHLSLFDPIITGGGRTMKMTATLVKIDGIFKLKVGLRQEVHWFDENDGPVVPAGYLPVNDGKYFLIKQP